MEINHIVDSHYIEWNEKGGMSVGMPNIPEGKFRPSWNETVIDLLESIALEEMAIAHLMNAEGEKAQEVVRRYGGGDLCQQEMHQSCQDAQSMMNSFIMKEWLLFTKLNTVLTMEGSVGRRDEGCGCGKEQSHKVCGDSTTIRSI